MSRIITLFCLLLPSCTAITCTGTCINQLCPTGYLCGMGNGINNVCCPANAGTQCQPATNGQCISPLVLTNGQCCPAGTSTGSCSTTTNGQCINGICPTGFSCIAGNICCATSSTSSATCSANGISLSVGPCIGSTCSSGYTCTTGTVDSLCCPNSEVTGGSSTCIDKPNPKTGTTDCPNLAYLCNDSVYFTLMTQMCPKTCNRCSATSNSTSSIACFDKTNPKTGRSDCLALSYLCNNPVYTSLMSIQCPKTCGRCGTIVGK